MFFLHDLIKFLVSSQSIHLQRALSTLGYGESSDGDSSDGESSDGETESSDGESSDGSSDGDSSDGDSSDGDSSDGYSLAQPGSPDLKPSSTLGYCSVC